MARPYSDDLRERVVEAVEAGSSRREAADRFEIAPSSAIKWLQRWRESGSVAAKPTGGSISPLEEHATCLLALVAEQPDLTLEEIVEAMHKRRIAGSRTAVWRFLKRHAISFKKKACARRNKSERTWPERAGAGSGGRAFWTRPRWSSSMKPRPVPIWFGSGDAAHAARD
jgi:transposase